MSKRKGGVPPALSREAVLDHIARNPKLSSKRDIAKALNVRGDDRIALKIILHELEQDGALERQGSRLVRHDALPPVAVLDVTGRDADGGLVGRPVDWDAGKGEAPTVRIGVSRFAKGPQAGVGNRVLARIFAPAHGSDQHTARVMKIIDLRKDAVLAVLRALPDGTWRAEPTDRKQPEHVIASGDENGAKAGDLVEVAPAGQARYGLPRGRVTAVIGAVTSEKAVSMIAIHAHGIPHVFPAEVLEEAAGLAPVVAAGAGREDWRSRAFVTIDPVDAKDHDDAVLAEPDGAADNPGGVIVHVAIADVAAYVRPGSRLDREAFLRGNSVYFPDRVVPMLPEAISNDACSLRENEDRPALAVSMRFSATGEKLSHSFHRILMRSHAKLAYAAAQAAIDGAPDARTAPLLDGVLRPLWAAYAILKRGRDARQPLELDLPERKVLLDDKGAVDRVVVPPRLDAHKLIEEFMIQANVSAAETLERRHLPLAYRVHDAPPMAKQEVLRNFLKTIGLSLAQGAALTPAKLNGILAQVAGTPKQDLVNTMMLRSQSQAVYAPENIGHFGLHLRRYAHFTSPIRRYADVIVHRALIAALGLGEGGVDTRVMSELPDVCEHVSMTERRAAAAERDTVDRLIALHLADRTGAVFAGRITGVTGAGLFVQLDEYGADGFVPIARVGAEYFHFDEAAQAIIGDRSGDGFRLADKIDVRLIDAQPMAGSMTFEMVSKPGRLDLASVSRHKLRHRPGGAPRRAGRPFNRGKAGR